jgi:hypothetical protein
MCYTCTERARGLANFMGFNLTVEVIVAELKLEEGNKEPSN